MTMIDIRNVSYAYDSSPVLKNVNFNETEPIITGLWGRNGAGKTTFMKLLSGLYPPDHGEIRILGEAPYNNQTAQSHICFIQENHPFHQNWKVKDLLQLGPYFYPNWSEETAKHLIDVFELPVNKKMRGFSKGMKSAAQIVLALASHADVTIIDEPANGLDAVIRKRFYSEVLQSFDENPRFLLLSSHHINEIQPLCDKLVTIHQNTIWFHRPMEELRGRGIILSGERKLVESLTANMTIMDQEQLGSTMRVTIDEQYSSDWEQWARENRLQIDTCSLQEYLVLIAGNKKEEAHK